MSPSYQKLPAIILSLTLAALATGAVILQIVERHIVETAGENLALAAVDIAEKLDLVLAERYGDIQMMAQADVFQRHDVRAMTEYLHQLQGAYPIYVWLGFTDQRGRIVASVNPASVGQDRGHAKWFQSVRSQQHIQLHDVGPSEEAEGGLVASFAAPILGAEGKFIGAVMTQVGLSSLEDAFARTVFPMQAQQGTAGRIEYQFLARDGTVTIDSALRQEGAVNLKQTGLPSAQLFDSAPPGYVEEEHLRRHVPVITGYAQTRGAGEFTGFSWGVLVRRDRRDVLAPIQDVLWKLGGAVSFVFVPTLGFLLWTSVRLRREWMQVQTEQARAIEAEASLGQRTTKLQSLVESARRLTAEPNLERLLDHLTEMAQRLTGARYAAMGVFDPTTGNLAKLITAGMDEATKQAIGRQPTGLGLLGFLAKEERALRLKDLTQHPASIGFPPHHPPMHSFLGVSIRAHGRLFGRLYLTEKEAAAEGIDEFTEIDEQVIVALAAQAGVAIENAALLSEVRAAETKYRLLLESTGDGIYGLDTEGYCAFVNKRGAELLGCAPTELAGKPFVDVARPSQPNGTAYPIDRFPIARVIRTRQSHQIDDVMVSRRDGSRFPAHCIVSPIIENGNLVGAVVVLCDLTERKRSEEALRASEASLADAQRIAHLGNWDWRITTNDLRWSDEVYRIFGLAPQEFGATYEAFLGSVHPDDREFVEQAMDDALYRNVPYSIDRRILLPDGTERTVHERAEVTLDEEGRPVRMMGTVQDISAQRQLEEQLRQVQKMEAIGLLAGGIAHDFNNLLTVITGYSEILLQIFPPGDPLRSNVEQIRQAGERAASLTNQLLAFSRRQALQPKVINLNHTLDVVQKMLRRLIGEQIDLATSLAPDLWQIKADPGQIEQVLLNLAVNARDAMPEGGRLTIETANVHLNETYARRLLTLRPGPHVMLAVSDTGAGMAPEIQARIFEPFFTTKPQGKGTGLGLSTVYGIVKQSGGAIFVYSEPGRGTTFKVYLPRADDSVEPDRSKRTSTAIRKGWETVLLVEDEEGVRTLGSAILHVSGYKVLEARTPDEALQIGARHEGPIHLLLTDVVMPGINGRELAERLLRSRPDMRVLYMSGYTDDAIVRHGVLEPGVAFVQKPFTPTALTQKVREVLDASPDK